MSRESELQDILINPPNSLPISGLSFTSTGIVPTWTVEPTQTQIDLFDSVVASYDLRPHRPRSLWDIRQNLNALSAAKKTAIWNDINSGTPPKWALERTDASYGIAAIEFSATSVAGITAAERTEARLRLVAMYIRGNPRYLVNPAFDPTINIPGDEVDV